WVAYEIVSTGSKCGGSHPRMVRVPPRRGVCAAARVAVAPAPTTSPEAPSFSRSRRETVGIGSARGEVGPERAGAARGDVAAQLGGPVRLAAELRAPRPEPPGGEVQGVLVGEADGAVGLVSEAGRDPGGLAGPDLRRR